MFRFHQFIAVWVIAATVIVTGAATRVRAQAVSEWRDTEEAYMAGMMRAATTNRDVTVFLPLKLTEVQIDVIAGVVHTHVTQVFVNDTPYPLEAVYVFPLPSRSAVTDMQLVVGNRRIRSVVQEKKEARQTYETARREGRRAAILEQQRPNIFTTSVANFEPGETVEVAFAYTEPAEYREGVYSLTYPMLVGPRYMPFNLSQDEKDALRLDLIETDDTDMRATLDFDTPPPASAECDLPETVLANEALATPAQLPHYIDLEHRVFIEVNLRGLPIEEITSSTHAITIDEQRSGIHTVRLADELTVPNCDFNLQIRLQPSTGPTMTFLASECTDDFSYGLLTLLPPSAAEPTEQPRLPRDVIFLVDTSGSMSGTCIKQAKAGLQHCMDMLTPDDRFTIVRFSDTFSSFAEQLEPADTATLAMARQYISNLNDGGGTEMQPALQHALSLTGRPEALRLVVFLTDGCVGNEDSLMRLLATHLGNARLFTFGIGSAPNEFLMRTMAEKGRGQTRFIASEEDVGWVMSDFFKTLDTPVMTDVSISWLDKNGWPSDEVITYPNPCPDVFMARPIQVAARFPTGFDGTMQINGTRSGSSVNFAYEFNGQTRLSYPTIQKLFGRARIAALMSERVQASDEQEREAIRLEVIDTALRHQLVSQFTSRVAVEDTVVRQPDGSLVAVNIPAPPAKGSSGRTVATATSDPTCLALGFSALLAAAGLWMTRTAYAIIPTDQ